MKTHYLTPSVALALAAASLGQSAETPRFADKLSGDWNGQRGLIADAGVEAFAYANAIVASNVSGGIDDETNYAGDIYAGLKFDLAKLANLPGTTFTLSGINRHGSSIDASVGGQYSVMQLVGGQNTFLYNVVLEKTSADGKFAFKFGRMTATDDFVGSPLYGYSLNNAVDGQIRAVLFDGVMTSYPFAVWGSRFKWQIDRESDLQVGVFQISNWMFDGTKHGLDFSIRGDDGVSVFTQYNRHTEIAGHKTNWFVGANNAFIDLTEFGSTKVTSHLFRAYGHIDTEVYREPGTTTGAGLTLFATFAYTAQDEVAIIPVQSTFGAHYKGLFAARPEDRTVFFATYGGFSDAYSASRVKAGSAAVDHETVIELGHRFQLTPYSYAQPDIQLVKRPGGTGRIDDAVVIGVQFGASF